MNSLKDGVLRDQLHRTEELRRELLQLGITVVELESRNKEIERANQNLEEEQQRKEKLIDQYENDIKQLRMLMGQKDGEFSAQIERFRGRSHE